jgi:transcriptional regulator with XRE-family HTH domain
MYHRHSPKGWDHWSRVMSNGVGFLGKDATFVSEVRSPTVRRRELGALLRKLRTENGLTVEQAADRLLFSMSKLSRMETGHGVATPRDIRDLCDLYGVTDEAEREHMTKLAAEGKQQAWWQSYDLGYATYVGLEAEAVAISAFQSSVVHGLLHTAAYARAQHQGSIPLLSADQIELQIEAKLTRQRILSIQDPPRFSVVLDEAALHRVVGGSQVMAAQLAKILEMATLPHVVVQILPFELGAHPALESNFTILELPDPAPGVVFVEGLIGSTYLERGEDLKRYREVFCKLQSMALNPQDTAGLIAEIIRSFERSLVLISATTRIACKLARWLREELLRLLCQACKFLQFAMGEFRCRRTAREQQAFTGERLDAVRITERA